MRGAGKRQVTSGSGSFRIGHLANHSARSQFCEPIRIQGKYIHVAGSRGAGNECEKVAIGLLWLIRKQVVNSVNQSEHDAKTFCWFQAWENAGELWICLWLVEKVLVARFFFELIVTRINVNTGAAEKSEAEEPYSKLIVCFWLFLSVFLSRDMFLAAGENLKAIDIIGQNGWVEK